MNYPTISIGIITRNRASLLEKCLNNLLNQTIKPESVIIVNNSSTDNTESVALKYRNELNIKYFEEKKIGIPFARNKVLEKCQSDILAFTDDDCQPPRKWIENILRSHSKNHKATIIQGKTIPLNNKSLMSILFKTNYEYWIWKNIYNKNLLGICDTNNMSLKVKDVKELKLRFSTTLSRGSDVDFAKKVLKKGGCILYDRKVKNFHAMRSNWVAFYFQRYKMGRAQIVLNKKWPDSNSDKGFSKDYYKQAIETMFNSVTGFRRVLLFLLYKTYHQIFWIGISQSKDEIQKPITPQKYIFNKPVVNITVAIVTRNREGYLEDCLRSLIKQTVMPSQVVIVDNASSDGTRNLTKRYSNILPIKYYYESNVGTAFARNKAISVSGSAITAFLDDDCIASSDWLNELSKAHRRNPGVVAIQGGCRVIPYKGALSYVYQIGYNHWLQNLTYGRNKLLTLDTANASFKTHLLQENNIKFDTKFTKYCDDEDLCQQLVNKNLEILYYPKILVGSRRRMSRVEFFKERFRKGLAKAVFDQKWNREIKKHQILLQGVAIKLRGYYNPSKIRVRQALLNPRPENLVSFFNTRDKGFTVMLKIRIITAFFELLYHIGYFVQRMNLRFRMLDEKVEVRNMAKSSLSLAVMIITKNRSEKLLRTLESLSNQTKKPDEVIIIDSSRDTINNLLTEYEKVLNIKYIHESKPGFGVARNRAIYNCSTDLIATIDDDAVADTNWCKNIVLVHASSNAIAIQGRIICLPKHSLIAQVEQIRLDKWFLGNLGLNSIFHTISTKNVSFKVEQLLEHGIQFSEDALIGKYGSEDLDIANRIVLNKLKIGYSPQIKIFHYERMGILSYIKQQYRKGCSNAVYDSFWKGVLNKPSYYLKMKKSIEPFLLMEAHPYASRNRLKQIAIIFVYFISLFFFNLGKKQMGVYLKRNIRRISSLSNNGRGGLLSDTAVILINSENSLLQKTLYSLANQSKSFSELFIFNSLNETEKRNITKNYRRYFKIRFITKNLKDYSQVLNQLVNLTKFKSIVFLDSNSDIESTWLEQSTKVQKENPKEIAINGFIAYLPKTSVSNIVYQFNYQTFIRRTMFGDKKNYWKLVDGRTKKDFRVPFFQFSNGSINLNNLRKSKIKFKEYFEIDPDINLGLQPFTSNLSNLLIPNHKIVLNKDISYKEWFGIGLRSGDMVSGNNFVSGELNTVNLINSSLKSLLAFGYFCIKNRYLYQLVPAVIAYMIYEMSFLFRVLLIRRIGIKRSVSIITR